MYKTPLSGVAYHLFKLLLERNIRGDLHICGLLVSDNGSFFLLYIFNGCNHNPSVACSETTRSCLSSFENVFPALLGISSPPGRNPSDHEAASGPVPVWMLAGRFTAKRGLRSRNVVDVRAP
jgi:hypothetical protein